MVEKFMVHISILFIAPLKFRVENHSSFLSFFLSVQFHCCEQDNLCFLSIFMFWVIWPVEVKVVGTSCVFPLSWKSLSFSQVFAKSFSVSPVVSYLYLCNTQQTHLSKPRFVISKSWKFMKQNFIFSIYNVLFLNFPACF